MLALSLPALQGITGLIRLKPLQGAIEAPGKPEGGIAAWWDGTLQVEAEEWLNAHVGFYPLFIRTNNQLNYTLFNKAKAKGVVIGK